MIRLNGCLPVTAAERAWLDIAPVGREFGSPEYEQLMEQDTRRAAVDAMHAFPKVQGMPAEDDYPGGQW